MLLRWGWSEGNWGLRVRETGFHTKTLIASAVFILAAPAVLFLDGPGWLFGLFVAAAFVSLLPSMYSDTRRDIEMLSIAKRQLGPPKFWLVMGGMVLLVALLAALWTKLSG